MFWAAKLNIINEFKGKTGFFGCNSQVILRIVIKMLLNTSQS
jgi:hypothetical protein